MNSVSFDLGNRLTIEDRTLVSPLERKTQILYEKAKKAKDRPSLQSFKRSYSLPDLLKSCETRTEKEACMAQDGFIWECIGRKPSYFGGYVYQYQAKQEYNDYTPHPDLEIRKEKAVQRTKEIFPAIESFPFEIMEVLGGSSVDDGLHQLGYQAWEKGGAVFIEMPDREALLGAYQGLKEKYPQQYLPDFEIASSDGIADDFSYAQAHFKGALLSTGREFCHDHFAHIIPRLVRALQGADFYQRTEKDLILRIFSLYGKIYMAQEQNPSLIQHAKKLNFLLGLTTDTLFSISSHLLEALNTELFVKTQIHSVCEDPNWKIYVQNRFPKDTPTNAAMTQLWSEVELAADDFIQTKIIAKVTRNFTQLKEPTQDLIKKNLNTFLRLRKEGLLVEDLEENFLKWLAKDIGNFLLLKKEGLSIQEILQLTVNQQNIIVKHFDELIDLSKNRSLQNLLTLKDSYPLERAFNRDFWGLDQHFKKLILKHPEALQQFNAIGIFIQDIIDLNTSIDHLFEKTSQDNLKLLRENGISVAGFSSKSAKWFSVVNPEHTIEFLKVGVSIDDLHRLDFNTRVVACYNPIRLGRLMQTGISIEKITALSKDDQKALVIYSEYIASEVTQETSTEKLSHLAKQGPIRNQERYERYIKRHNEIKIPISLPIGWEENPEGLTLQEEFLDQALRLFNLEVQQGN